MKKLKIAVSNWNGVTTDLIEKLKERGHTLFTTIEEKNKDFLKKIDVLITWNEVHQYGNDIFLQEVKDAGVKTILVQHGRRGTSRIYPPFNESLICHKACLWGENDRRRLTETGNDPKRLFVTGTPIFRHLKPRVKHEGINVVFSAEHWGDEVFENNVVASTLRKIKGINVISKLLLGEHTPSEYDNPIMSDRHSKEHWDIVADVLSKADVVVAISESTFELLAQSLDIPVIIADIWVPKSCQGDPRYKEYFREFSKGCTMVKDMSKMEEAIKYAVKHPEHLRKERAEVVIGDGGTNIKDPTMELIKIIEEPWIS
jgi:hypothetical protein